MAWRTAYETGTEQCFWAARWMQAAAVLRATRSSKLTITKSHLVLLYAYHYHRTVWNRTNNLLTGTVEALQYTPTRCFGSNDRSEMLIAAKEAGEKKISKTTPSSCFHP
jgi:hypothetical protein